MKIVNLTNDEQLIGQTAGLLIDGFRKSGTDFWTTAESAVAEVRESLGENRISRIAIGENESVLGWIGGIEEYDGHIWELHPLVVRPDQQRKGLGRALVEDFEKQVKKRGGAVAIRVGTDDENNRTSLGGVDLYPDVLKHLTEIKNLREHPFEFYQKLGYIITGVVPDANGFGKPDILMTKRI